MKTIELTQNKVAMVDNEDFDFLSKFNWCATIWGSRSDSWYAVRLDSDGNTIAMHNAILQPTDGMIVDHKDCNGLNNTRANLRLATRDQNLQNARLSVRNKSGYKGVSFAKGKQMWKAEICCNKRKLFLGYFRDSRDAAIAYDTAARELFKGFARLNFPQEGEQSCVPLRT